MTEPTAKRILAELTAIRKQQKVTQKELSHRLFVDATFVSRYERGCRVPTIATLERMASALGYELEINLRERVEIAK